MHIYNYFYHSHILFTILEQHASALILLTPIVSDIGANFLLVPDIVVELRDEVGIRISTGRESSLVS